MVSKHASHRYIMLKNKYVYLFLSNIKYSATMSSFFDDVNNFDNFDLFFNSIAQNANDSHTEYTAANAPKSQFDTGLSDPYPYLAIPDPGSPLSSLSANQSTSPSRSSTTAPDRGRHTAPGDVIRSGSDSDVEPLSLAGEQAVVQRTNIVSET